MIYKKSLRYNKEAQGFFNTFIYHNDVLNGKIMKLNMISSVLIYIELIAHEYYSKQYELCNIGEDGKIMIVKKVVLSFLTIFILIFGINFRAAAEEKIINFSGCRSIAVNKISFDRVSTEHAPDRIINLINIYKKSKGFVYYTDDKGGYTYIGILMGQKNTGGYSLKVTDVQNNDGKTNVFVEEIWPSESDIVIQVITYPYVIIRVKGTISNITVTGSLHVNYDSLDEHEKVIGVDSAEGIITRIEKMENKVFITIRDGNNNTKAFYADIDSKAAQSAFNEYNTGDKVIIKYALGTPQKYKELSAFPFSYIKNADDSVDAEENTEEDWIDMKAYINVSKSKSWTVKFNKSIISAILNMETIYIRDANGKKIDVKLTRDGNRKIVITPLTQYKSGSTYYLFISNKINEDGFLKSFDRGFRMKFTIK